MTYTRITQTYGWSRDIPGYYQDVPYINHMDAVFAKYYTDAYYNYKDGNRAAVPGAWLKAFDAARDKRMTGTGDLLLGINAHVNRDLPFVLAGMGLVRPDGQSGKPDFDKANQFLNDASDGDDGRAGRALRPDHRRLRTTRSGWRTGRSCRCSRPGESCLAQRRGPGERPDPRGTSRRGGRASSPRPNTIANMIVLTQSYTPPLTTTASRDAYCAVHKGDAAPMAYPFGMPTPYGG